MADSTSDALAQLTHRFRNEWRGDNSLVFYDFLVAVKALVTRHDVDPIDAALTITGTAFVPGVDDDPLREEITMVAADLETGRPHYARHTWSYLFKLIDELGDQLAA